MFELRDVIRYNSGWLAILSFSAKGSTWYVPVPVHRTHIDGIIQGQSMLSGLFSSKEGLITTLALTYVAMGFIGQGIHSVQLWWQSLFGG